MINVFLDSCSKKILTREMLHGGKHQDGGRHQDKNLMHWFGLLFGWNQSQVQNYTPFLSKMVEF